MNSEEENSEEFYKRRSKVFEILKVYSITNKTKVNCDYKVIRTGTIYLKDITMEKSYKAFEKLINVLNTHR